MYSVLVLTISLHYVLIYTSFCRRFEIETVAMTASMLHGNADVVGNITSGGTESILCAVKVYRDVEGICTLTSLNLKWLMFI